MSVRTDLLELTPEALTALANAGFVKRAQKDMAAGQLPRLEVSDDGAVTAYFDDAVRTHLAPGRSLRDADCNCQATGMCRHRVLLVLTYQRQQATAEADAAASATQDSFWSPAEFDDAALSASLSPTVLAMAERLAAERPVVTLQPMRLGQPPLAQLPMSSVRFFSRSSLAHARCDCKQGSGCVHVVLALWAFREAARLGRDTTGGSVEVQPSAAAELPKDAAVSPLQSVAAQEARAQIEGFILSLWLDGSSQPLANLAARMEALRAQVISLGWNWVVDALDELWLLLQSQHARSSRFDAQRLLMVATELWARLRAADHSQVLNREGSSVDPARPLMQTSQILGIGVKGQVELDHLKLVSLGAVLWSDDTHEGANVLLADADTQTVSVLAREWPLNPAAASVVESLAGRRVAGFPLRQLASGQVITKSATRRANGQVSIGSGGRQTGVMPLSPVSWDELQAPLRQTSVRALIEQLRGTAPDFTMPRQAANGAASDAVGCLHVLSFGQARVVHCAWDAAAQVLNARIANLTSPGWVGAHPADEEPELLLALPHRVASAHAVDALARALSGEWGLLRAVAGTVQLQDGRAVMHPLALLTTQRGVVLQLEAAAASPLVMQTGRTERSELSALVADTMGLLTQWLRQGLRHQGRGADSRIQTQAQRLQQAGLRRCARLLGTAQDGLRSDQRAGLLAALSTLVLLLQEVGR